MGPVKGDEGDENQEDVIDDSAWGEGLGDLKEIENVKLDAGDQLIDPTPGKSIADYWADNSQHPAVHIAAGSFSSAMEILSKACGIADFKPLKPYFMALYASGHSVMPVTPSMLPLSIPLQKDLRVNNEQNKDSSLPAIFTVTVDELASKKMILAQNAVSKNQLEEALVIFRQIMHQLLFVEIQNRKEERVVLDLIRSCAEYVTAMKLELARRGLPASDALRGAELAAYFTKCKIQNKHLLLGLKAAMTTSFKLDNFIYAAGFANRILKMSPQENLAKQAKLALQTKDQKPYNKQEMRYDEKNMFVICNGTFTPIYAGGEKTQCAYCGSTYQPTYTGQLCSVCQIGKIGGSALGLYKYISQFNVQSSQDMEDSGW